jgi:cell division protein FtsL
MTAPRAGMELGARPRPAGGLGAKPNPQPALRPVPEPRPPRRPWLEVVPEPAVARRRRRARLFTALAGTAACFGLFGVVGVQVLLAQGQSEVERLSTEVRRQEEEEERLRLRVAELESPARVVREARERLGMTSPTTVVALAPASLADPPPTTVPAPRATTTTTVQSASTTTLASAGTAGASRP